MTLLPRPLHAAILAIAGLTLASMAVAADRPAARHPPKPAFPQIELPEGRSKGQRAVDLLGARLPEVAAWYRKSPDEFRSLLLQDRRLRLDRRGRLFVEEELEQPLTAEASSPSLTGELQPLDQTFALHSKPGAKRTVYLNFRGALISNTAWNNGGGPLTALPFDTDGVPYSFSTSELQRIQYIWQRVAEDYAPFDVDVTTEEPPSDRLTRSGATDDVFGTTVVVTSRSGVYSCSCGGVAYVGVFDDSDFYKPALVFYDALGSGNEKYVAEAISHEAGHNVGLLHDGYSGGGYYGGHGSGATGWAPIMGVGYYQALVQWSRGEYATANNTQDDYAVMATNGLAQRPDDHAGSLGGATPMTGTTNGTLASLRGEGIVERPGDVDVFAFSAGAGSASFGAAPAARSPNVDLRLELRDAVGNVLASANPGNALPASFTYALPAAGTYYLAVTGVGQGDPLTTGYTNYGSVGQYAVTADVPAGGTGLPPVAVLTAAPTRGTVPLTVVFSAAGSSDPDGSIAGHAWTFGDGGSASGATASHTYTTAGSFTAQLRVTDNTGLSAVQSTVITVDPVVALVPMRVADIAMSLSVSRNRARAVATVSVRDGQGQPVAGATVAGRWSGVVSGTASVTTDSAGVARFNSANTRSSGTFTFTVTGVARDGHEYQPALNAETSDSITR